MLDLTRFAAAYGPRLLAEAGHRVIRVEPACGDDLRHMPPFLRNRQDSDHGAYHHFLNAGKESLTLDPTTASGREVLRNLAGLADCAIVTQPHVILADELLEMNPRLIVVEVDDVQNELAAFARSGLLALTGHPHQMPVLLGAHSALSAIGLYVSIAAFAALFAARLDGGGRHIEVSSRQCLESLAEQSALAYHTTGKTTERRGFRGEITAVSGAFACADGYWMVSVPHNRDGWARLVAWTGDPALADPVLVEDDQRVLKRDFILDRISEWSKAYPKSELVHQAQERHIPASPVATAQDLATDPQLIARGFLREMDHPQFGPLRFPVGALARSKGRSIAAAPRLGEHNAAILTELGYSQDEQRAFLKRAIV